MTYRAPVPDIVFTMRHAAGLDRAVADRVYGDLSVGLAETILDEAGRFANDVIAPLNRAGDTHGVTLKDGVVTTAPGWKEAYRAWTEAGWNALPGPVEHGGQGLPTLLNSACVEMWNSASMAFGIGPVLTHGAIEALAAHASEDLKARYLEKLVSGEWTATMNLTEPQAGSDLAALRSRAEPAGNGAYRITGQKIFITYGEHDLTDNIIHLVLARLPDAPQGTRGISLFLVPKVLPDGARNDVRCHSIEHKLGIHASPTCTMIFGDEGGAVGWLVGEENRGLACMFTMMNNARLAVGLQGVAVAERATQQALAYARERRQGRSLRGGAEGMAPFVEQTGAAQHLRDARILPIYEGTNGIQAIDLVMRKLPLAGGDTVRRQIASMRAVSVDLVKDASPAFGLSAPRLREAVDSLDRATSFMLKALAGNRQEYALAGATPYLRLFGLAQGGAALAKAALAANAAVKAGATDPAHAARVVLCRFFAENLVPACRGLEEAVVSGASFVEDAEL